MIPSIRFLFCFSVLGCCIANSLIGQGSNRRPKIEILKEIDLEEGRQMLSDFRRMWVLGDMSLKYSLQFIPRRGKRHEINGTLWGSTNLDGPVSLIQIQGQSISQLYLKSGYFPSVSKKAGEFTPWEEVEVSNWFKVVDDEVTLTAFDLMMPFIYWPNWTYEGVTKVNSRVAHAFLMLAPDSLKDNSIGLHGVVVFLDESFHALLKAEYVTEDDFVLKSLRLIRIKKVNDLWLPKTMDFLDEKTRDKTRLTIKEAATHRNFSNHPLGRGELPGSVPEIPLSAYTELR